MDKYKNKSICIVGFGVEGKDALDFFRHKQCKEIVVVDEKAELPKGLDGIEFVKKRLDEFNFDKFDVIIRSPGIHPKRLINAKGIVTTCVNIFFEENKSKTIAVTGTKGKSTTVSLIKALLEANGKESTVIGNIGNPVLESLESQEANRWSILELSSFQLIDFKGKPDIAIFLPISIDHLNYHEDEDEYSQAKFQLVANQSSKDITFAPIDLKNNLEKIAKSAQIYYKSNDFPSEVIEAAKEVMTPPVNLVVTSMLANHLGISYDAKSISQLLKKPPFRLQEMSRCSGIRFINDSASTNPVSTEKAIEVISEPYVLVMGGSDKGLDFGHLATKLSQDGNLLKVVLIGDIANKISLELSNKKINHEVLGNLDNFFNQLVKKQQEMTVLFSPACASFDQFENYKIRGEIFNKKVKNFCES